MSGDGDGDGDGNRNGDRDRDGDGDGAGDGDVGGAGDGKLCTTAIKEAAMKRICLQSMATAICTLHENVIATIPLLPADIPELLKD